MENLRHVASRWVSEYQKVHSNVLPGVWCRMRKCKYLYSIAHMNSSVVAFTVSGISALVDFSLWRISLLISILRLYTSIQVYPDGALVSLQFIAPVCSKRWFSDVFVVSYHTMRRMVAAEVLQSVSEWIMWWAFFTVDCSEPLISLILIVQGGVSC
jgi:hypothetical protein